MDARLFGVVSFDSLEPDRLADAPSEWPCYSPDWKPVNNHCECSAAEYRIDRGSCDRALLRHTPRHCGFFALHILHRRPDDDRDCKYNERCNDTTLGPITTFAAPLESQYESNDRSKEDHGPDWIEFAKLLPPAQLLELFAGFADIRETEVHKGEDDGTHGQVNVEAPGSWSATLGPMRVKETYHLQLTLSVRAPPITGPRTEAMESAAPTNPAYKLRFRSGMFFAMMMKTPPSTPAPPMPAIALPMIRPMEEGVAPHTALPIKNMNTETW